MWKHRPRREDWFVRIKTRAGYRAAIGEWLNASYMPLMEEKGAEAQPRIKAILEAA